MSLFYCLCFHSVECKICTKSFENLLKNFQGYHVINLSKVRDSNQGKLTEKEGFEPSRRDYRPTPFPGEPLQPLGYFSSQAFESMLHFLRSVSGERGIRTLAPFRTNGFQDRLVMTTSISLHNKLIRIFKSRRLRQRLDYLIKIKSYCQQLFAKFLKIFFDYFFCNLYIIRGCYFYIFIAPHYDS